MINSSSMLTSDYDEEHSSSDEFKINFSQKSSNDFGLGYWINTSSRCAEPQLPFHASSNKSVFAPVVANSFSLSSSNQKSKRTKNNNSLSTARTRDDSSPNIKGHTASDIPRLKIPKHVVKKVFKQFSPIHSSPKSELRSRSKYKSTCRTSECKSNSSSYVTNNSRCLEKSFEKSQNSINVVNDDVMHLALTIDHKIHSEFPSLSRSNPPIGLMDIDRVFNSTPCDTITKSTTTLASSPTEQNISTQCYSELNQDCLSAFQPATVEGQQHMLKLDSTSKPVNCRKRSIDSVSDNGDEESCVSNKRKMPEPGSVNVSGTAKIQPKEKHVHNMTPIDFVKFLASRLQTFENFICEKYCLAQPNAMKFLAQSHAANWESNKNNIHQLHLVPCGFLKEIFHRALFCFGLEKKILKETMAGNTSPIGDCVQSHSVEYKKLRDEYSYSLKRVRYGIGVIDELFRRRVNYQNIPQNNDVIIVRKWKHIIYYLSLHAKSVFMAKEMQYHNYSQGPLGTFDVVTEACVDNNSNARCLSNIASDTYNKLQLPKESSKSFDCKFNAKTSPEPFSQSDLEISPHSYDSGKGSSLRMPLSNTNSHTASSLNSTPRDNTNPHDIKLHLPGYQLYRIDQYQTTATEYVRLLPDAAQLHQRIVAQIGTEPNANSRDSMIKWIIYTDCCQKMMTSPDPMTDCLERLLTHVVLPL